MQKILFKTLIILYIIYIAVFPFNISSVFHMIMFCLYAAVLAIGMNYILKGKYNKIDVLLQLLIIHLVIIEAIYYQIEFTIDNILTIFSFLALVVILSAHNRLKIDNNLHNFIFYSGLVLAFILIVFSFLPFAYKEGLRTTIHLTLGLGNSNFTGIILFCTFSMIWVEMPSRSNKIGPLLVATWLIYLIYLTHSRTSLLSTIFIIIYSLFLARKKIPKWVIILINLVPVFFVTLYLYLYEIGFNTINILGKKFFSGREIIYLRYLNEISSLGHLIFGNMKKVFFLNTGNAPLAIICSIGLLGALALYAILFRNLCTVQNILSTQISRTAIVVILSIALHSSSESAMFLGGIPSLVSMYTFLVLTHDRNTGT